MNLLLPLAFLGLFNYGSLYEATQACKSWVKEGDTREVTTTETHTPPPLCPIWNRCREPRAIPYTITKTKTVPLRSCYYREVKSSRQILGFTYRKNSIKYFRF